MSFSIKITDEFERNLKRLVKKYPSLKGEYVALIQELALNPSLGTLISENVYKIRVAIASKGRGKSGGARVITYVQVDANTLILVTIYNKGEQDSISLNEIKAIIQDYL